MIALECREWIWKGLLLYLWLVLVVKYDDDDDEGTMHADKIIHDKCGETQPSAQFVIYVSEFKLPLNFISTRNRLMSHFIKLKMFSWLWFNRDIDRRINLKTNISIIQIKWEF